MERNTYDSYNDVVFDRSDKTTWPAIVISTTIEAGKDYAEILQLKNYIVRNSVDTIQGMFVRAIVITPGYLAKAERAQYDAMSGYWAAIHTFTVTSNVRG